MGFRIFFLLFLALSLFSCTSGGKDIKASKGVLDLSTVDFSRGKIVTLDGEWEVFTGAIIPPLSPPGDKYSPVPGYWNEVLGLKAEGYGTYRLTLKLPGQGVTYGLECPSILTAYSLWIDGKKAAAVGTVGTDGVQSRPGDGLRTIFFTPQGPTTELLVQISNFHYRKGGIWESFHLGLQNFVFTKVMVSRSSEVFLIGALGVMAFYHFGLFLLRRKDRTTLWFALFCVVVILRFIAAGGVILDQWFPDFDFEWRKRLEFLVFNFGCIPFIFFLYTLFPKDYSKKIQLFFVAVASVFGTIILVTPTVVNNHLVLPMEIFVLGALIYQIFCLVKASLKGREGAALVLIGLGIILITAINDILYSNQIWDSTYLMPFGFFLFMFLQAYILSMKFVRSFAKEEKVSEELKQTNKALGRFMPSEFLKFLQKDKITEVKLGDQVQKNMTVLFCDIRSFTAFSEALTPSQTFNFLNSYFGRISPLIRAHGGIVDKYIGDAIMGLFPNSPEDALKAAIAFQQEMCLYNLQRQSVGYAPISIGTGLHTGSLMIGTIGEENRMDTTVISDAVNLASRLETLTKTYGKGTLFTMDFLENIPNPDIYHWRYLGVVRVYGRKEKMEIAHLYDGLSEKEFEAFDSTKKAFEEALSAYRNGDLDIAGEIFNHVLIRNPDDKASATYLSKIQGFLEKGIPPDWDGIEAQSQK